LRYDQDQARQTDQQGEDIGHRAVNDARYMVEMLKGDLRVEVNCIKYESVANLVPAIMIVHAIEKLTVAVEANTVAIEHTREQREPDVSAKHDFEDA
jgi:hypothetical protein